MITTATAVKILALLVITLIVVLCLLPMILRLVDIATLTLG